MYSGSPLGSVEPDGAIDTADPEAHDVSNGGAAHSGLAALAEGLGAIPDSPTRFHSDLAADLEDHFVFSTEGRDNIAVEGTEPGADSLSAAENGVSELAADILDQTAPEVTRRELVFVDTAVADYELLVRDLRDGLDSQARFEVVLIGPQENGIGKISRALAARSGVDAVHVISHGSEGRVNLGDVSLGLNNLDRFAESIAGWNTALRDGADILLYGCDVAAQAEGRALTAALSDLCGCDVAASVDDTGHAALGGDWELEYQTGEIETAIVFGDYVQANWGYLLDVTVNATTVDTTPAGASSDSFAHTTSGSDRLMLVGISFGHNDEERVNSVTYNGTPLALMGARDNADSESARVEIWSLVAPATGTHNVVVNYSDTDHDGATIGVTTFNGVDQVSALGSFESAQGDSGSLSTTVLSGSGELVFGVAALDDDNDWDLVPGLGQSEQWDAYVSYANGAGSTEPGAASVVTSWTVATSSKWAVGGIAIKPSDSVLKVDTTNDVVDGDTTSIGSLLGNKGLDGAISLREAILAANGTPNGATPDAIHFDIPGTGLHTISLLFALPDITDTVVLDATTQNGYAGVPRIEIDGSLATGNGFKLSSGAGGSVIRGFVIGGFSSNGMEIVSDNNVVELNYIGTDATGNSTHGNDHGVQINGGQGNTVRDNVISGNTAHGIWIHGTSGSGDDNTVQGNLIGTTANGSGDLGNALDGLRVASASNTIGGLAMGAGNTISGNDGNGIVITGSGAISNTVLGNRIGVSSTGAAGIGNTLNGLLIENQAGLNVIGDMSMSAGKNVISGNNGFGVVIKDTGSGNNRLYGNHIGVDAGGSSAIGNALGGVQIASGAANNSVGGMGATTHNVIAGNGAAGMVIRDSGTDNNTVAGSYIGVNFDGSSQLSNAGDGVVLNAGARNNMVGGTTVSDRNVISANTGSGIRIRDANTSGNVVQGNYIGVNAAGTSSLGNTNDGVSISSGATNNTIGGNAIGAGNLIASNASDGIQIETSATSGNQVLGNVIGTNSGGDNLGNGDFGIRIANGAATTPIGGLAAAEANVIAHNGLGGLVVEGGSTTGVTVRGNSIHSNNGLGIDLANDGVTTNDSGDGDNGPNRLQNFPLLSSVSSDGTDTTITGTLSSKSFTSYLVDFYSSPTADPSGFGEGQVHLGSASVMTTGSGDAALNEVLLGVSVNPGDRVSATATDPSGNTSEFSMSVTAAATNVPPVAVNDGFELYEDGSLSTALNWFDGNWKQRRKLIFDNSLQPENLVDFPVLIVLDGTRIDYARVRDAGEDLRFTDADGAPLDYEIESWNESGSSYVWVKVPQIDASSNSDFIWMYYDNPLALDNQNAAGVWSNSFQLVSHLNDDFLDSSGNGNHGNNFGSADALGVIADGQLFDGNNDRIRINSDSSINNLFAGGSTISAWINPDGWGEAGYGRILDKSNATLASAGWALQLDAAGQRLLFESGFSLATGAWRTPLNSISLSTPQFVALVYDSSSTSDDPTVYIDGTAVGVTESTTPIGSAASDAGLDLAIGNRSGATDRTFDGLLDEIQLSTAARSASWIAAQHLSMTDSLVTFAAAESANGVLLNDADAEGDSLTAFQVGGGPSQALSFVLHPNGSFTYVPVANFFGVDTFTYKVNDGNSDSNVALVSITVHPVNDPPVLSGMVTSPLSYTEGDGKMTVAESIVVGDLDDPVLTSATVTVSSNFVSGQDVLTAVDAGAISSTWNPATGTLTLTGGDTLANYASVLQTVTYENTSEDPSTNPRTIRFVVNDGTTPSNAVSRMVNVISQNDAPVAEAESFALAEDTTLSVTAPGLLANDSDAEADALTAVLVSGPDHGMLVFHANGSFDYTPVANFFGVDTFHYRAFDGSVHSAPVTVTLNVSAVNDVPVAAADAYTANVGQVLNVEANGVLNNDSDIEGSSLTAVLVTMPTHGSVTLNADGSFFYTPNAAYVGTDTFSYSAHDGLDPSVPVAVSIEITVGAVTPAPPPPANGDEPPEPGNGEVQAPENEARPGGGTDADTGRDELNSSDRRLESGGGSPEFAELPVENSGERVSGFGGLEIDIPLQDLSSISTFELDTLTKTRSTNSDARRDESPMLQEATTVGKLTLDGLVSITHTELTFLTDKNSAFWKDMEEIEQVVEKDMKISANVERSALGVTAGLSVGYIVYMLRSGYLVSCILANLPAWKMVDPMPVFDDVLRGADEDDESLESMIAEANFREAYGKSQRSGAGADGPESIA